MNREYRLSKSKILSGLQCPKRLYLEVNHPEYAAENSGAEMRIGMGNEVGEIARQLIPDGVFLDDSYSLTEALAETKRLLHKQDKSAIFEATFSTGNLLVRGDILTHDENGYRLYEVKSSTGVKDYHLQDCAIQSWVIEQAGYPLSETYLSHINNQFIYKTPGNYDGLLTSVPVTQDIAALKEQVPDWQAMCRSTLAGDLPEIEPGEQCHQPFSCPFQNYCRKDDQTPDYPVTSLPRSKKLASELIDEGVFDIRDIPEGRLKNSKHIRIREAALSSKAYIGSEASKIINSLPYPRYYIDFETISFAVPIWLGTRPYQQLPFQWSCHIEHEDGSLEHQEFLDTSGEAPMRQFTESLLNAISDEGPVLVYNAGFESMVLKNMAILFPEYSEHVNNILNRMVDLLTIARDHYYHPDMHGSWSIKAVLPTIAPELDYANLEGVHHGGEAQSAFLECISPDLEEDKRDLLLEGLKRYCELDTYAMVKISDFFAQGIIT